MTTRILPFYIFHHPIIVYVGYFVVRWHLPVLVKYPLIMVLAFFIILVLYHFVVRRHNVLRIAFGIWNEGQTIGMRPRASQRGHNRMKRRTSAQSAQH